MIKNKLIDNNIFSVYMSFDKENNGEVLFGKVDTNYMGSNFDFLLSNKGWFLVNKVRGFNIWN